MAVSFIPSRVRRIALVLAAVALAGCATTVSTPELVIRERANNHWKARIAGDLDATYAFMPPSYRAITSLASYKKGFGAGVQLTAAQVERVRCESEDKCVSVTKVEGRAALQRASTSAFSTYYEETWVREQGQWWLFPTP